MEHPSRQPTKIVPCSRFVHEHRGQEIAFSSRFGPGLVLQESWTVAIVAKEALPGSMLKP